MNRTTTQNRNQHHGIRGRSLSGIVEAATAASQIVQGGSAASPTPGNKDSARSRGKSACGTRRGTGPFDRQIASSFSPDPAKYGRRNECPTIIRYPAPGARPMPNVIRVCPILTVFVMPSPRQTQDENSKQLSRSKKPYGGEGQDYR